MMLRAFVAIGMSLPGQSFLAERIRSYQTQEQTQAIRWLEPNNFHITLAFLGDVSESTIVQLDSELELLCLSFNSFPIQLIGASPFPLNKHPHTIVAIVEQETHLLKLQKAVALQVNQLGISLEKRRFIPHVTLGRARRDIQFKAGFGTEAFEWSENVQSIGIYRSELRPSGSVYTPLVTIPLME